MPNPLSGERKVTSTSFAAQLPALSHTEFDRLRVWGEENCAAPVLYRDDACVVWLASRERARNRKQIARAVRSTLKKLTIDASGLKNKGWR